MPANVQRRQIKNPLKFAGKPGKYFERLSAGI